MSKIEVNQISSQCGSTLTIGQSGDTVTLASGATQTGFGRTGTVNWDTTAKTAGFTAVSGNGYFVNTTSGAITVTLPATPSAGDIVALQDYAGTWADNNVTIARNGSNIGGAALDAILSSSNQSITLVYVDGTRGWQTINDSTQAIQASLFVTATGGTITTCGDYKIHTFTGPGTFCVSCEGNAGGSNTVDYLVVAGGGSGGIGNTAGGAGGGAGGLRVSSGTASGCWTASPLGACVSALPVSATGYPITVGAGGASVSSPPYGQAGNQGNNSVFSTITSAGGGKGAGHDAAGSTGGSGGGGSGAGPRAPEAGFSGNTPPVSPPQGQDGGNGGNLAPDYPSGGGGGAGGAAPDRTSSNQPGGPGGAGIQVNICGSNYYWAGGGGGEGYGQPGGAGGIGGGGGGSASGGENGPACGGAAGGSAINTASAGTPINGGSGATNSGGGGGGAVGASPTGNGDSGGGGSGIVIIRYKYQ